MAIPGVRKRVAADMAATDPALQAFLRRVSTSRAQATNEKPPQGRLFYWQQEGVRKKKRGIAEGAAAVAASRE